MQPVAKFLITRQAAQSPADNRFVVAQRGERLQVEQLSPAGLKPGGEVARTVISRENKGTQRRHIASIERSPKFCGCSFLFRTTDFSALDAFAKRLLDPRQDSVASLAILLLLLIIVEPERRINTNEHQNQFSNPAADSRQTGAFFSSLTH